MRKPVGEVVGCGHTYHPGVYPEEKVAGGDQGPGRPMDGGETGPVASIFSLTKTSW